MADFVVDETRKPLPIYKKRVEGTHFLSTVLSAAAVVSGSSIDVRGLDKVTVYAMRSVSANSIEIEGSPDGTNWYSFTTFTGALPATNGQTYAFGDSSPQFVRLNLNAWSSGIVSAQLTGLIK